MGERSTESVDEQARRRTRDGEHRLPPAGAVIVAAAAYATLPSDVLFAPRVVIPAVEVALLIAVLATNPRRLDRRTRWSRATSMTLACVVVATNLVTLVVLIDKLVSTDPKAGSLLLAAMQVWLTNVIGFALLFWEIDRGGPVMRRTLPREELPAADWRFSNDEDDDSVAEVATTASGTSGWVPIFVDYLYLSLTNSSAFSPTDTMPLSSRAKMLMGLESTAALFTSLLVVARAVGSLKGG